MTKKIVDVGTFELKSGVVLISDPCYIIDGHKPVWCMGTLTDVKTGKWSAHVDYRNMEDWGNRVCQIWAIHDDLKGKIPTTGWKLEKFEVGVDSGQAGIFEHKAVRSDGQEEQGAFDQTHWYGRCCNITCPPDHGKDLRPAPAGIVDGNGFVSSSGYGDGGYQCRTRKKDNLIVSIKIRLI